MQATVAEMIKIAETELKNDGHRNVKYKRTSPCTVGQSSWSFLLFDNRVIPQDTIVSDDKGTFTDPYSHKKDGVLLTFESIPPRKRNPVTTEKRYIIVQ